MLGKWDADTTRFLTEEECVGEQRSCCCPRPAPCNLAGTLPHPDPACTPAPRPTTLALAALAPPGKEGIVREAYSFLARVGAINFGLLFGDPRVPLPADLEARMRVRVRRQGRHRGGLATQGACRRCVLRPLPGADARRIPPPPLQEAGHGGGGDAPFPSDERIAEALYEIMAAADLNVWASWGHGRRCRGCCGRVSQLAGPLQHAGGILHPRLLPLPPSHPPLLPLPPTARPAGHHRKDAAAAGGRSAGC